MIINKAFFEVITVNILLLLSLSVHSQEEDSGKESFMLLAGYRATADGSVLVAQNKGSEIQEGPFINRYPRQQHDSAEIIRLQNDLEIPQTNISMSWISLQTKNGIMEGDAVAVNEHQVSIAGTVSLESDRNEKAREADPLEADGITAEFLYLALERARTAREYITLLGEYFNKYGIAQAKGIAIADKREVWYMETGGGQHWAAIKIPDDAVWLQANGYRIGNVDPDDDDAMASPGLQEFARENDLWNPNEQLFDFADAFGNKMQNEEGMDSFNGLKIWRAINLLDSTLRVTPDQREYPQFIRPQNKVDLPELISVLRDHYSRTSYNNLSDDTLARKIRPIASENVVHTSIVQLTNGLPASVGAVLWSGFSSPLTTPYIPFYFGIKTVPKPYNDMTPENQRAYQFYQGLEEEYYRNPERSEEKFPQVWSDFQTKCLTEQVHIDRGAMRLYQMNSSMARQFITTNVEALSIEALDLAKETLKELRKSN